MPRRSFSEGGLTAFVLTDFGGTLKKSKANEDRKIFCGPIAQLGERLICIQEVSGSIPLGSTISLKLLIKRNLNSEFRFNLNSDFRFQSFLKGEDLLLNRK